MKRFTETTKWDDPWFRRLLPLHKNLWQYICDKCDPAGVIEFDPELASFCIGDKIVFKDLEAFEGRIEEIAKGKWLIKRFLEFQYTTLSQSCPAHKVVFSALERHSLPFPKNTLLSSLSDRGQDTEQIRIRNGQGKGTDGGRRGEPAPELIGALEFAKTGSTVPITPECVAAWFDDRTRAEWCFPKAGQMVPVGDWRADLRSYARSWQRNEEASTARGNGNGKAPGKESAWSIQKRIDAAEESKRGLLGINRYKNLSDDKKKKVDALNDSIDKLKAKLAECPE